jgi:hypothetical protein
MKRFRRILAVLTALVVLAGALYAALLIRRPVEMALAYWKVDAQIVGVVVLDAPNLSCEIARVEESASAVSIHAQCQERLIPVAQPAMAQQYVFNVSLHAPLGARTVHDGSGNPAGLCQVPAPDCIPTT